jgi:hypothetical protein
MFMARASGIWSSRAQVPLPDVAVEGGLSVDLVLVDVNGPVEELHDRLNQARMTPQASKRLVVGMGCEGGANRFAILLTPDLVALHREEPRQFPLEEIDFFAEEQIGQKHPALGVKLLQLCRCQFHDHFSTNWVIWTQWPNSPEMGAAVGFPTGTRAGC